MTKILSKKATFNVLKVILICVLSILPYLHDFNFFAGKKGFSGFSSLRVGIWVVSLFLVAISGWVFALINAKGVRYRFAFLVPITMLFYQLLVYVLDERKSVINNFNIKILVNILIFILVAFFYFRRKSLKNNE